jgi:hypothetical protein
VDFEFRVFIHFLQGEKGRKMKNQKKKHYVFVFSNAKHCTSFFSDIKTRLSNEILILRYTKHFIVIKKAIKIICKIYIFIQFQNKRKSISITRENINVNKCNSVYEKAFFFFFFSE